MASAVVPIRLLESKSPTHVVATAWHGRARGGGAIKSSQVRVLCLGQGVGQSLAGGGHRGRAAGTGRSGQHAEPDVPRSVRGSTIRWPSSMRCASIWSFCSLAWLPGGTPLYPAPSDVVLLVVVTGGRRPPRRGILNWKAEVRAAGADPGTAAHQAAAAHEQSRGRPAYVQRCAQLVLL